MGIVVFLAVFSTRTSDCDTLLDSSPVGNASGFHVIPVDVVVH